MTTRIYPIRQSTGIEVGRGRGTARRGRLLFSTPESPRRHGIFGSPESQALFPRCSGRLPVARPKDTAEESDQQKARSTGEQLELVSHG